MTSTALTTVTGAEAITAGRTSLGIELGSTRIKASLIDEEGVQLASGSHTWENELVDDNWTYAIDAVWSGLQACIAELHGDVRDRWGAELMHVAGLGVSAMMHGYLAFDAAGELLVPFRTWRNTYTTEAAAQLTDALGQNIPLRWSVAHLLHAVLGGEEHVSRIARITTLAGYVHERLSGRAVLGVGDASGVFPIDAETHSYDVVKLEAFDALEAVADVPWSLGSILPEVLTAGEDAGQLTASGALLLDPTGTLQPGAVMAPPEGDAGTGMVATNSVRPRTGNVSAGTSAFAMVVLEKPLGGVRDEIDLVTTPAGDPVAMIHTNNCTGDLDAWLQMFTEFAQLVGADVEPTELYRLLYTHAMTGAADGGGLLSYNYLSGEHQTGVASGRPLFARSQDADFTLANLMRTHLYAAFGALASGMRVLGDENVALDELFGHGGIFRTAGVAQHVLADALDTPVSVSSAAGEGGAWGMAILAGFAARQAAASDAVVGAAGATSGAAGAITGAAVSSGGVDGGLRSLADYLTGVIFTDTEFVTAQPDPVGVAGYADWLAHYQQGLPVERLAGATLR
ncbi:xylulokinase [Microbacterium sp. MPKO10]|uniref:xylulokinase n=1 Tax=Microbacterium sp. MPKO10 TaxID=2989818 RepID=UPI002236879C|nr:FGGY-family carbohydrate kinase [Microbacterium sp. MPKO10]MCW4457447.1 FGGY-family carbohydrate kinase [Microbacterium sp. MPKO10]